MTNEEKRVSPLAVHILNFPDIFKSLITEFTVQLPQLSVTFLALLCILCCTLQVTGYYGI